MSLDTPGLFTALSSHAMTLGLFDRVNNHEPHNAPGNGLTCAFWWMRLAPALSSGLSSTSGVVTFMARIFKPAPIPQDENDLEVLTATDALIAAYSGDFTLGDRVRQADLLGQTGQPLSAQAGWLTVDENTKYRTSDITIPLIVNDLFTQAP